MMNRIALAAAVLCAAPMVARAQTAAAVDEVVVTATRLPSPGIDKTYTVATLDAERLAGSQSVADALSTVADIHVQAPGGRGGVASLFLRGADPNFTTVLLDGVAVNDSTNSRGGSVNVSEIDAALLERIDIVAGPLSGLFGSGALAGAINLAVPGGTGTLQSQAIAGVGTLGDTSAALRISGPLAAAYSGSMTATASDDGDVSPGSSFNAWSLTGKVAPTGSATTNRLIARVSSVDARTFPDSSGGPRFATRRALQDRDAREVLAGISQRAWTRGAASVDLHATWLHRREAMSSPGVAPSTFDPAGLPASEDQSTYRRAMVQAIARRGGTRWSLAGGAELQREQGTNAGQLTFFGMRLPTSFDLQRDSVAAFAEGGFTSAALTANVGVRADDVAELGRHVTARGGIRYVLPAMNLALRAAAGTGFKSPSFYALGNPLVGNTALLPERSASVELGLDWSNDGGIDASLTMFRARYTDLIDFDPGPPPRLVNRSEVVSRGVSASFKKHLGQQIALDFQAQHVRTLDDQGTLLLNRPRWRASVGVSWVATPKVSLQINDSFVDARYDYAIPTGVRQLNSYHRVSAQAVFAVSRATVVRVGIDNALDADYEDAVGFPAPHGRARLTLTRRF